MSIIDKIIKVDFPDNQYHKEETTKTQIVLHHTASGPGARGDINYWLSNSSTVATAIVIDRDGTPYQCFSTKYWSYHLGLDKDVFKNNLVAYRPLDKTSIGVEIDNWGFLTKKGNKFYSWTNQEVNPDNVVTYSTPFRGNKYFEKYTTEQIDTVKGLLLYWKDKWNIPLTYNDSWDISKKALQGTPGVWYHCNFHSGKTDIHPQKEMIDMLKTL